MLESVRLIYMFRGVSEGSAKHQEKVGGGGWDRDTELKNWINR